LITYSTDARLDIRQPYGEPPGNGAGAGRDRVTPPIPSLNVPLVSVVIPTKDRPHLLREAVDSALAQTEEDLEVVVVDDGSRTPVTVPADRRVRLVRHGEGRGNAAARNTGLAEARGRWLTCLDDDDVLTPRHLEVAFAALAASTLPPPVAALAAVAVIGPDGRTVEERLPPTLPRGSHFSLEPRPPGRSYNTKQTLVVETEVLRGIGGWDPSFRSRTVTELFLRLNPVCSLQGVDTVTYHLRDHPGWRVSRDPDLRQASFDQLVAKHRSLFRAHPDGYADLLVDHAVVCLRDGNRRSALAALATATRRSPRQLIRRRGTVRTAGRALLARRT
jgi:hypothetical protein